MREILFKAKHTKDREWVCGSYVTYKSLHDGNIEHRIIDNIGDVFVVDPKTVCQYTGLTDKNGVKIFEGDVLSYNGSKEIVRYDTSLRIPCFTTGIGSGSSTAPHPYKISVRHVVVGNIYD